MKHLILILAVAAAVSGCGRKKSHSHLLGDSYNPQAPIRVCNSTSNVNMVVGVAEGGSHSYFESPLSPGRCHTYEFSRTGPVPMGVTGRYWMTTWYARSADGTWEWEGPHKSSCFRIDGDPAPLDIGSTADCPHYSTEKFTTGISAGGTINFSESNASRIGSTDPGTPSASAQDKLAEKTSENEQLKAQIRELEDKIEDCKDLYAKIENLDLYFVDFSALRANDSCELDRDALERDTKDALEKLKKRIGEVVADLQAIYSQAKSEMARYGVSGAQIEQEYERVGTHPVWRQNTSTDRGVERFYHFIGIERYWQLYMQPAIAKLFRRDFIASVASWSDTFAYLGENFSGEEGASERLGYLESVRAVNDLVRQHGNFKGRGADGYPEDSPVPEDARKQVANIVVKHAPGPGAALEASLQSINTESLTPEQIRILKLVPVLAEGFTHLASTSIDGIREASDQWHHLTRKTADLVTASIKQTGCLAISLSDAVDLYEATQGKDFCTGEELTAAGKVVAAVSVVAGSTKVLRAMAEAVGISTVVRNAADLALDAADRFKLTDVAARKAYAAIHSAVDSLPANLRVQRVRGGTSPSKIAIIGRSMGNPQNNLVGVNDVAKHLRSKGLSPKTFEPTKEASDRFTRRVQDYRDEIGDQSALLPDHLAKETQMYRENLEWVWDLKDEGYQVLDIGNPNNLDLPSVFYEMEKTILF